MKWEVMIFQRKKDDGRMEEQNGKDDDKSTNKNINKTKWFNQKQSTIDIGWVQKTSSAHRLAPHIFNVWLNNIIFANNSHII